LAVAIDGRDFGREAGEARDGIGADAREFAGTANVPHGDVFNGGRVDLRVSFEECAHYLGAYFVKTSGDELSAAAAAECRARSIDDDSVLKLQSFVPLVIWAVRI
jgi:hypothetical protein